ncbi:hypothetical protein [Streptomyces sp. GQFP]
MEGQLGALGMALNAAVWNTLYTGAAVRELDPDAPAAAGGPGVW